MSLILDAIVSPDLFGQVADNVKNSVVVDSTRNGVSGFVESVLGRVGGDKMTVWKEIRPQKFKSISVLRIWSHAWVNFERSETENGNINFGRPVINSLNAKNLGDFKMNLASLTPYFTSSARVELRGCIPAKGTGAKMMLDLADLWKVHIYGSDKYMPQILSWASTVFIARPGAAKIVPVTGPDVN